jgi:drug/metabolite transporter (DMT)-like permease
METATDGILLNPWFFQDLVLDAYLFAFVAVIAGALDGIVFRYTMQKGVSALAALTLFHVIAVILLCSFESIPSLSGLGGYEYLFLALSCALWLVGDYYAAEAYEYLDAAICELYASLSLIFVTIAGVFLFRESISPIGMLGIGLMIGSAAYQLNFDALWLNRGTSFALIGMLFISGALVVDKYLTTLINEKILIFYGFLTPMILYFFLCRKRGLKLLPILKKTRYIFLLSPVLGVISYYCLIMAFSSGQLSITYTIQETGLIFVFLFEAVLLKSREHFVQRALTCLTCASGAVMVCLTSHA